MALTTSTEYLENNVCLCNRDFNREKTAEIFKALAIDIEEGKCTNRLT